MTLVISKDEMEDIMKIVKSLKVSELLLKGIPEWTKRMKKRTFLVCY